MSTVGGNSAAAAADEAVEDVVGKHNGISFDPDRENLAWNNPFPS